MARRQKRDEPVNTNEWITTYSDTVTLLLCFFILLFSFSTINAQKWEQIVEALNIDVEKVSTTPPQSSTPQEPIISDLVKTPNDILYDTVKDYIDNHNLTSKVELLKGDRMITLRFKDTILFDPDKTYLKDGGKEILLRICDILKNSIDLIEMIEIEGHTSANPEGLRQYTRTFEFSTERALNVLRFVLDKKNIDPLKLKAVGYGQYHPIGDNETEEGRIKNRRVEIKVTSSESDIKNIEAGTQNKEPSSGN